MKKFEAPEMVVEELMVMDVITTSICEEFDPDCPYDTGR